MKNRERGRELLFTQMLMRTPLSRLRTVLGADQSICHRTDDAIHATTAAQGSLTTHSAKGPEGACVCVCARPSLEPDSGSHDTTLIQKQRVEERRWSDGDREGRMDRCL